MSTYEELLASLSILKSELRRACAERDTTQELADKYCQDLAEARGLFYRHEHPRLPQRAPGEGEQAMTPLERELDKQLAEAETEVELAYSQLQDERLWTRKYKADLAEARGLLERARNALPIPQLVGRAHKTDGFYSELVHFLDAHPAQTTTVRSEVEIRERLGKYKARHDELNSATCLVDDEWQQLDTARHEIFTLRWVLNLDAHPVQEQSKLMGRKWPLSVPGYQPPNSDAAPYNSREKKQC